MRTDILFLQELPTLIEDHSIPGEFQGGNSIVLHIERRNGPFEGCAGELLLLRSQLNIRRSIGVESDRGQVFQCLAMEGTLQFELVFTNNSEWSELGYQSGGDPHSI